MRKRRKGERGALLLSISILTLATRVISEVITNNVNHAPKFQAMMTLPQQQLHNKHLLALCLHAYHSSLKLTRREKLVIMQIPCLTLNSCSQVRAERVQTELN